MYRLSDLQCIEPESLPVREGLLIEVHPDPDSMGLPRVDVVGDSAEGIIEYVREHWGDDDEQWFAEYVVARMWEGPLPFSIYASGGSHGWSP